MDKLKIVDKLREKADISYEEAKEALENSDWDILEAMLYLEGRGKVKKPDVSEFCTNDCRDGYSAQDGGAVIKVEEFKDNNNHRGSNDFHGIFELICKIIDTGNNIFLEVRRKGNFIFKLPLTVIAVLLFFTFGGTIPLMIIGLFFEIEFTIVSKRFDADLIAKVNKLFKQLSVGAIDIKDKIMEHIHINMQK